jgi:hypothetical protein
MDFRTLQENRFTWVKCYGIGNVSRGKRPGARGQKKEARRKKKDDSGGRVASFGGFSKLQAAEYRFEESLRVGETGFYDEFVGAELEAFLPGFFLNIGGTDDHRSAIFPGRVFFQKLKSI